MYGVEKAKDINAVLAMQLHALIVPIKNHAHRKHLPWSNEGGEEGGIWLALPQTDATSRICGDCMGR